MLACWAARVATTPKTDTYSLSIGSSTLRLQAGHRFCQKAQPRAGIGDSLDSFPAKLRIWLVSRRSTIVELRRYPVESRIEDWEADW